MTSAGRRLGAAVTIVRQSPWAAKASTALLPFELAYWTGFAVPFGFVFGLGRFLLMRQNPTVTDDSHTAAASSRP